MTQDTGQIRENVFQRRHAEAMQALIWALSVKNKEQQAQIEALHVKHKEALKEDAELQKVYRAATKAVIAQLNQKISEDKFKEAVDEVIAYEKAYLEDLERKATRHKLSIFFAFFMALGCGTTIAGSNFLMGAEHGWIANIGFLSAVAIVSLPIIISVTMANWWLGVRAVADLENTNKDAYKILENKLGPYSKRKWILFAIGMLLIELYNGIWLNFKPSKTKKKYTVGIVLRGLLYGTVLLGSFIYAFFAFAATYNLGMGIFDFLITKGLATSGGFQTAAITSSFFGMLMAIPTYITMKIIYFVYGKNAVTEGEGPLDIINSIPGANKPGLFGLSLKHWFIICGALIIASVAFMTYAATAPLAAWLHLAGMATGAKPLATVIIAFAFVGNVPFFLGSAAKSFKQLFDPREQLKDSSSKWFPYIRFWNAVLNALPAVVGILAFCGLIALPGPWTLLLPIVLNFIISPAGGVASYFANSNGTPTMYQFDPAKQLSKFHLRQLTKLGKGEELSGNYEALSPNVQLHAEYVGAKVYMDEASKGLSMPILAKSLHCVVSKNADKLESDHKVALYNALTNPPMNLLSRTYSFFIHDNVHYTQKIFPYDYLNRIEKFASNSAKERLYDAALEGGGNATLLYRNLLGKGAVNQTFDIAELSLGSNAKLFWKSYSTKDTAEQERIIQNIPVNYRSQPQIQELLMKHSQPEVRKGLIVDMPQHGITLASKDGDQNIIRYLNNNLKNPGEFAYKHFHAENILESNLITGFLGKNLMFPVVLLCSAITSAAKYVARRIPFLAPIVAEPVDIYQYFTELADEKTRIKYLSDVLSGYIDTYPSDKSAAISLQKIINGQGNVDFAEGEAGCLRSGTVGRVFALAGKIPSIKEKLLAALDRADAREKNNEVVQPKAQQSEIILLRNDEQKPSNHGIYHGRFRVENAVFPCVSKPNNPPLLTRAAN